MSDDLPLTSRAENHATPVAWFSALVGRRPLVLAPGDVRGWFGGRPIVAFDPTSSGRDDGPRSEALRAAAEVLESARDAEQPALAVVLAPYSGAVRWAVYERGFVLSSSGWEPWGTPPAGGWPGVPAGASESEEVPGSEIAPVRALGTTLDRGAFCRAVEAIREAILDGDVYVLNLTRIVTATTALSGPELFAALLGGGAAQMGAAWEPGGDAPVVLSASPERFLRITGHEIEIAPVKGTRARGLTPDADRALAAELSASEKERAEHVMIVDLERNDLGRVCVPGSVRVDPLFALESTSYCHQAVSRVRGLMRSDAGLGEVLKATFPCGSITGAPKVAAMRIASELEDGERGVYTGSMLVAVPGAIDSSVLIRTAELSHDGSVRYGTGCGITVDSDPDAEWEESVLKTTPLLGQHQPLPVSGSSVALKETCRVVSGAVPLWPYHRARLAGGGCGEELLATVDARVAEAAAPWVDAATRRARLTVVVSPDGDVAVEVAKRLSSLDVVGGIVVVRVDVAAPPPLPHPAAKPADRSWWDAAHRAAAAAGGDQGVLVTPDGLVVDGSTACVWIAEDGVLSTPPTPHAIPSVSRAFVLASAEHAGLQTRVEPITWERFAAADEAFFTNAFGGAAPVRGRGGALFSAVRALFDEAWRDTRQ